MTTPVVKDLYLERLKRARDVPATLKATLVEIRSNTDGVIFIFEGIDDKLIYSQWVKRIKPLKYESMVCRGKEAVFQLIEVVRRDKSDLGKDVYFFVDRDFDDYQGNEEYPFLFMSDAYSVENYLVSNEVIHEVLENLFHCHGQPKLREEICEMFGKAYGEFLEVTKEVNFKIFTARKLKLQIADIPEQISRFAKIELSGVKPCDPLGETNIVITPAPEAGTVDALRREFDQLTPSSRYRGKFAHKFLIRWLDHLRKEYERKDSTIFARIRRTERVRSHELTFGTLASSSPMPTNLKEFIEKIA